MRDSTVQTSLGHVSFERYHMASFKDRNFMGESHESHISPQNYTELKITFRKKMNRMNCIKTNPFFALAHTLHAYFSTKQPQLCQYSTIATI